MTLPERNAAIEQNLPLIRKFVRIAVGERKEDEYLGVGVLTFIDRYPRHDPCKGPLDSFLARAIIGECRRELWCNGASAVALPKPGQHVKKTGRTNYDELYYKRRSRQIKPHHRVTPSHVPALIAGEDRAKAWELVGRLRDRRQSEVIALRLAGIPHGCIDGLMGMGQGLSNWHHRRAMGNLRAMVAIGSVKE